MKIDWFRCARQDADIERMRITSGIADMGITDVKFVAADGGPLEPALERTARHLLIY